MKKTTIWLKFFFIITDVLTDRSSVMDVDDSDSTRLELQCEGLSLEKIVSVQSTHDLEVQGHPEELPASVARVLNFEIDSKVTISYCAYQ